MPYMYLLECADDTYYVGSTKDIERRLRQHNEGMGANYTSKRLPIKLVYYEEFNRIDDAYCRERQIHNWSHGKKEALIKNNTKKLQLLSRKVLIKRKK